VENMFNKVVPVKSKASGIAKRNQRGMFGRRRRQKPKSLPTDIPEYSSWIGRWSLVAQTGYREWLASRVMGPGEIDTHIKSLFNHTWVEISDTKEGVKITTSSKVRGKLRRQVASFEYVLDGMTALTMQSPLGPVSMTASIDGVALVHKVNTPNGIETHRRQAVKSPKGDRLMQTMIDAKGNTATLEYQRIKQ
jgi:hypothetical protein